MTVATDQIREYMITRHAGSPYYGDAETEGWLEPFWSQQSPFREAFDTLDLSYTLELACGHGRHSAQSIGSIGSLILVDVNKSNIDACRKRFAGRPNITFLVNDGRTLAGVSSSSLTTVFSYDAMVHFEAEDVISYIREISRVLRPGGRALLHYSNNDLPGVNPFEDQSWRNYFSRPMMHHFAQRAGLTVLRSHTLHWGGRKDLDGLVVLERTGTHQAVEPVSTLSLFRRMFNPLTSRWKSQ